MNKILTLSDLAAQVPFILFNLFQIPLSEVEQQFDFFSPVKLMDFSGLYSLNGITLNFQGLYQSYKRLLTTLHCFVGGKSLCIDGLTFKFYCFFVWEFHWTKSLAVLNSALY